MVIHTSPLVTIQANLRFAEFFAGIGLVRKGLEQQDWQCVFANDIDRVKGEIYTKNFGKEYLQIDDVANLHASDIPNVTLFTASFPCQDLSLAGNRKGLAGKHSGTFFEFTRILGELATSERLPQLILIENVTGLLTSNEGNDIREVILLLNQLGYSCDLLIIDAVHFLPQSRPRLFIIGFKRISFVETFLTLSTNKNNYFLQHPCRPLAVQKVVLGNPDLSWNFLNLSPLPTTRKATLIDILETRNNLEWFGEKELERELSYIRNRSQERLDKAKKLAHSKSQTVYLTAYRRMRKGEVCLETRSDGIAGCLRTVSGGSSRQVLIAVSPEKIKMRYMTAREYARLQGVEDSFWIPENQNVGRYAFGDAVAVPVLAWLGGELKHHLTKRSQKNFVLPAPNLGSLGAGV